MDLQQLRESLATRDQRGGWHMAGLEAITLEHTGRVVVRVEVSD